MEILALLLQRFHFLDKLEVKLTQLKTSEDGYIRENAALQTGLYLGRGRGGGGENPGCG